MNSLPFFSLLILLALACGGNKSISQTNAPETISYRDKINQIQLNKSNQLKVLHAFLGYYNPELELPDRKLSQFEKVGIRYFLSQTQNMAQNLGYEAIQNQTFFKPSLSGLFGGSVDYLVKWNDNKGSLTLHFENFNSDGLYSWKGLNRFL